MSNKAEIKKIVLDLGADTEIVINLDQAKKLHSVLDEMFGRKTEYIPAPYPVYPVIYERNRPYWTFGQETWSSNDGTVQGRFEADSGNMCLSVGR